MKPKIIKDSLTACKYDELSEVALKIIQTTGWQTDLNRPCITKVMEVVTGDKSTTIVMEYVRRDEKSDREVYYYNNVLAEQNSTVEGKQVI